ncbi:MAG: type I 3-dehydroquinate dehydratase [Nanoarchaeota archaeon]
MKLCGCVNEETFNKVIETANSSDADMIEHRIDYMQQSDKLDNIYSAINKPVIATNRRKDEGGKCFQNEAQRINSLVKAIRSGCNFVDIELNPKFDTFTTILCRISI